MTWFSVLKMPNPYGGRWADLTGDEYYRMDEKNKMNYHLLMRSAYYKQIRRAVNPRKAGQAPPATDEQIRGLRELYRFHGRQYGRLKDPNINKENYYSLEEEKNRQMSRPKYDAVEEIPPTTKEMYDNYTREQKMKYWNRLASQYNRKYGKTHPNAVAAGTMVSRMKRNPNYNPPFEGEKLSIVEFRDLSNRDVSEYYDFTEDEKRKYHSRHSSRHPNGSELNRFHSRMEQRIFNNSSLPTYPTLEAEKEAEQ